MSESQNGWTANDPDTVSSRLVPGTAVRLRVRNGPAGDLLLAVAAAFDRDVQNIDNARGALDDWGYAERPIRGGTELSNHASGTAIDLNAVRWPLGSAPSVNLSPAQIAMVRVLVARTGGVIRWGGDYTGRLDPMHFEINDGRTAADCAAALAAFTAAGGQRMATANISQAEWDQVKGALAVLVQQVCGERSTLANPAVTGWPTWRYNDPNRPLTLVDMLRTIDRQISSGLDLTGRPGGDRDDPFGQALSTRAELRDVDSTVDEVRDMVRDGIRPLLEQLVNQLSNLKGTAP